MNRRKRHKGSALVEFAVVIPIILLVTIAVININSLFYLKQSAKLACYEGCRAGIVPGAKSLNVEAQVNEILNARRIKNYSVQVDPIDLNQLKPGDYVTVRVLVQSSANVPFGSWLSLHPMDCQVAMMCEL